MDKSIEKASNKCKRLYKKSIHVNATEEDRENYTKYRNLYNKLKSQSRMKYYSEKCSEYKKNTKKLWELMNRIIGKTKHSGSIISHITVSGVKVYNKEQILLENFTPNWEPTWQRTFNRDHMQLITTFCRYQGLQTV